MDDLHIHGGETCNWPDQTWQKVLSLTLLIRVFSDVERKALYACLEKIAVGRTLVDVEPLPFMEWERQGLGGSHSLLLVSF